MSAADRTAPTAQPDLASRLAQLGDPGCMHGWHKGERDYAAELNMSLADVPALLATTRAWFERADPAEDPEALDDPSVYAPIHAWRALGQLRAENAVNALLELMASDAAADDDWCLGEFPHVFALIGAPAIDRVAAFARDASREMYPRVAAARGLVEIAKEHPDSRSRVVSLLINLLLSYEDEPSDFNAFVISHLLDVRANEAADLIERAFADNCVDVSIVGNWNDARAELGVEGHGIVAPKLANAKPVWVRRGAAPSMSADERANERAEEPPDEAQRAAGQQRRHKKRKRKSR